ncbi:hypothetical protein Bca52824_065955 [Brassica carinata]|uniref:Uncharacterized protein n=1 Tax=Brassica carinata TaxID=52824 RepID=A0A8X7QJB7_BRACI|nr:hypothetical protein Bca52824_065955 [Brassica carinata]
MRGSALSELWIGAIIQGGFLAWRDDALAWRPWREKIGLHVRVVIHADEKPGFWVKVTIVRLAARSGSCLGGWGEAEEFSL